MSILLFFYGQQGAITSTSRRRYVDDPMYAVAIGNRLPMNAVESDLGSISTTGNKDSDFIVVRDNSTIKLAVFDADNGVWKYTSLVNEEVIRFTSTQNYNLPAATGSFKKYTFICDGVNVVITVTANGSDTINGEATQILLNHDGMILHDTASGVWNIG